MAMPGRRLRISGCTLDFPFQSLTGVLRAILRERDHTPSCRRRMGSKCAEQIACTGIPDRPDYL